MRIFSIIMLVIIGAGGVFSDGWTQEKPFYTVGVEDIAYLPHYATIDKKYIGLAHDVLAAFAKKKGLQFDYKPFPVNRLHKNFMAKNLDFVYPNNPDWMTELKKDTSVYYSNALVNVVDGVMVSPENKGAGLQNLKIIGTIQGFSLPAYEKLIQSKKIRISESHEFKGLLKAVIKQNIDGAYVTIDSGIYQLRKILKQPKALVFDDSLPYDISQHCFSSIKYPEIIKAFNNFLISEKELMAQLKAKYHITEVFQNQK